MALFISTQSFVAVMLLTLAGTILSGYQLYLAALSPYPILQDEVIGEVLCVSLLFGYLEILASCSLGLTKYNLSYIADFDTSSADWHLLLRQGGSGRHLPAPGQEGAAMVRHLHPSGLLHWSHHHLHPDKRGESFHGQLC